MWKYAALVSVFVALPAHAQCIDLLDDEALRLSGTLRREIFPGPPNYADVRKGDAPEPTYILELDRETCARGDTTIPEGATFRTVHVYSANDDKTIWSQLRRLVGRRIDVQGVRAFGALTGHHHAPVVMAIASVVEIRAVAQGEEVVPPAVSEPPARSPTVNPGSRMAPDPGAARPGFGSAQEIVEAFYAALSAGNGDYASGLVVPEKRASGPFSAAEITRFYGSLAEPLQLLDVTPVGIDRYRVRYTFVQGRNGRCEGDALVSTRRIGNQNLIAGIRATTGC